MPSLHPTHPGGASLIACLILTGALVFMLQPDYPRLKWEHVQCEP